MRNKPHCPTLGKIFGDHCLTYPHLTPGAELQLSFQSDLTFDLYNSPSWERNYVTNALPSPQVGEVGHAIDRCITATSNVMDSSMIAIV